MILTVKFFSRKCLSKLLFVSILLFIFPWEEKANSRLAFAETIINVTVSDGNQGNNSSSSSSDIDLNPNQEIDRTRQSTNNSSSTSLPITFSDSTTVESLFPDLEKIVPPQPMPPLPTSIPNREKIVIQGNSTPQNHSKMGNNLVLSNEILPYPPVLSDPYQEKETATLSTEINILASDNRTLTFTQAESRKNPTTPSNSSTLTQNTSRYVAPEPTSISPF